MLKHVFSASSHLYSYFPSDVIWSSVSLADYEPPGGTTNWAPSLTRSLILIFGQKFLLKLVVHRFLRNSITHMPASKTPLQYFLFFVLTASLQLASCAITYAEQVSLFTSAPCLFTLYWHESSMST